jgi:hypothetical protein
LSEEYELVPERGFWDRTYIVPTISPLEIRMLS